MTIVLICTESKGWFFDLPCTLRNQIEEHCKSQVSAHSSSLQMANSFSALQAIERLADKALAGPPVLQSSRTQLKKMETGADKISRRLEALS